MTAAPAGAFGAALGQWALARLLAETEDKPANVRERVLGSVPEPYRGWARALRGLAPESRLQAFRTALDGHEDRETIARAVFAVDTESPEPTNPNAPRLNLVSWADLKPKAQQWGPGGFDAVGALTVYAGDGGIGKTRLVMSRAAATSRRQRWPSIAPPCPDGVEVRDLADGVLFSGDEDAIETTLLPVFLACGGDQTKVKSIDSVFVPVRAEDGSGRDVGFDLSESAMDAMEEVLETGEYGQLIPDGLTGFVTGDGNSETDVRRSLRPLTRRLRNYTTMGTGIMHFGKGVKRASDKLIQSVAFRNVARAIYYVVPDPEEYPGGRPERPDYRRLVFNEKINGGVLRDPFAYRVQATPLPEFGIDTGGIAWCPEPAAITLNEALAAADALPAQASSHQNAPQAVLKAMLMVKGGWALQQELVATAERLDIPERTLQYAKKRLGLQARRDGAGPGSAVWWGLPGLPEPAALRGLP